MEKTTLEKINRFTRRELGEDEVYTFSVILCDNDIDRDLERFSDEALVTLAEKFIGRTGDLRPRPEFRQSDRAYFRHTDNDRREPNHRLRRSLSLFKGRGLHGANFVKCRTYQGN